MARHGFVRGAAGMDGVRRGKSAGSGYRAALLKVRDVHEEVTTAGAESGVCIAECGTLPRICAEKARKIRQTVN